MPDTTSTRVDTVTVADGSFAAHVTLPPGGSGPGILLLQEIFGVNDFLCSKAADLAALGYVIVAPDVFWRVEPGVDLPHDDASLERGLGLMGRYASEVSLDDKTADLVAAFSHLRSLPEVEGHEAGVVGYCLGGWLAYLVAAHAEPDACVSYYGSGIADCVDLASRITCPVLFHFGGKDPYIPGELVDKIATAFSPREDVTILVEPEAGHAFENLMAPQFANPEAARRSFAATTSWLAEHLR